MISDSGTTAILTSNPSTSAEELFARGRCYVSVNPQTGFVKSDEFAAVLAWISDYFKECCIYLDDCLASITLETNVDETPSKGAEDEDDPAEQEIRHLIAAMKDTPCEFTLVRCSVLKGNKQFIVNHGTVISLFTDDEAFRRIVMRAAQLTMLHSESEGMININRDAALSLCIIYVLEQLAATATLCEYGYNIEISVDVDAHLYRDLLNSSIENIPSSLKDRVHIQVNSACKYALRQAI